MAMNYIRHLTGFFDRVADDRNLNPTHISLYIALFQFWNCNRFRNPISISRDEIMRISKIASKATYHKCLKELHAKAYIKYEPSFNPYKGSHVWLFDFSDLLKPLGKSEQKGSNFSPVVRQVEGTQETASDTAKEELGGQALVPSINNTNVSKETNDRKGANENSPTQNLSEIDFAFQKKEEMANENFEGKTNFSDAAFADHNENQNEAGRQKSGAKKEEKKFLVTPSLEEVLLFFEASGFPEIEGKKFHSYFQSNGWLVGGKAPMADWKAASQKWMLNFDFLKTAKPGAIGNLNASVDKNYSEPL